MPFNVGALTASMHAVLFGIVLNALRRGRERVDKPRTLLGRLWAAWRARRVTAALATDAGAAVVAGAAAAAGVEATAVRPKQD